MASAITSGAHPITGEEMRRRTNIAALIVVSTAAFAGTTASVATATTSVEAGSQAFTCKNSGTNAGKNKFSDADCTNVNNSTGEFRHIAFGEEETEVKLTNLTNTMIKTKIGLVNTSVTSTAESCLLCKLRDAIFGGIHVSIGTIQIGWNNSTTTTTNCRIKEEKIESKPLKITSLSSTTVLLEPVAGTVVAEFNFENFGGTCPLVPNNPIKIEGHMDGTLVGAELTFNTVAGMLNVGSQSAFLTGVSTLSGRKDSSQAFTALGFTPA